MKKKLKKILKILAVAFGLFIYTAIMVLTTYFANELFPIGMIVFAILLMLFAAYMIVKEP